MNRPKKITWKKRIGLLGLLVFMFAAAPVQAAVIGIGVTGKVGTTGLGADLTVPLISNWVNLRAGYNWLGFSPSIDKGGINYEADVDLQSIPILIDLHPFHGNFRVTGGVFHNLSDISLTSTVNAGTDIGGATAGSTTSLRAEMDWSKEWAPYFGIGWGNAADDNTLDLPIAIGFSVDIGAYYQGSPSVLLTQTAGTAIPTANLAEEARQIEDDMSGFKWFPVVTVGLHVRF